MNKHYSSYTGKRVESYKKPPASLNKISRIGTTPYREPDGQDMNIHKSPYSEEEGGGRRRRRRKTGP